MDAQTVVAIGGGVSGLGGLAAVLKVFADSRANKRKSDVSVVGLANALNSTAKDWIDYIDDKFDKVSDEFQSFKALQEAKERARLVLHQRHRLWDFEVKNKLEAATGEPLADPPPLDIDPKDTGST